VKERTWGRRLEIQSPLKSGWVCIEVALTRDLKERDPKLLRLTKEKATFLSECGTFPLFIKENLVAYPAEQTESRSITRFETVSFEASAPKIWL
jgi:hypothetical protein